MNLPRLPEPSTSALDFAPEILAIERRPPSPLPRFLLYTLLSLFLLIVVWICIARLDIVASAEGRLVPQTHLKIVQPVESGVLKEILIREGDRVQAGQVLMRLDTTLSDADRAIIQRDVEYLRLQIARIDSELDGRPMEDIQVVDALSVQVHAQARARRRAYEDLLGTERAVLEQVEAQLESARQQVIKLEKILPSLREEEGSLDKLAAEGNVARMHAHEKQRERVSAEQDLRSQIRTVEGLESRLNEARSRMAGITSDYRQQLLSERVETQAALDKSLQQLAKEERRTELSQLRAPQDGIIKDVATYTVGAVVSSGSVLASLVPINEVLQAEVLIRNEDVGFVVPGQSVKVKLAAYPFQKYGLINGVVTRIAADADEVGRSTSGAVGGTASEAQPSGTYKAIIALEAQQLVRDANRLALAPGMRVVAEIKQGERTILEYLMSPVRKALHEAGRER